MNPIDSSVRICPVCHHRQHRNDPTRHVCASELLKTVRELREELAAAHADLEAISALAGSKDAAAGAQALLRELAASQRYAKSAHERGYTAGIRLARVLLRRLGQRVPFGRRLVGGTIATLSGCD